jgi:hypothetical protein
LRHLRYFVSEHVDGIIWLHRAVSDELRTGETIVTAGLSLNWSVRKALALLLVSALSVAVCLSPTSAAQPQTSQSSVPTRLEGYLKAISPGKWLVGDHSILVDAQTAVIEKRGRAEVGAWVIVWGIQDEDGSVHAELIQVDRPAGSSGPTVQFSGMLRKMTDDLWVIEQTPVRVTGTTMISGNPTIGALVWIVAEQQNDILAAIAIEVLAQDADAPPVEFEGVIEAFGPEFWKVDGNLVRRTPGTIVIGDPALDKNAEVRAIAGIDGELVADLIRVVDPTAEARLNAVVTEIAAGPAGEQTWKVLVFPDEPWADPVATTLHIDSNTLVDEGRATARVGQWAEVRGAEVGSGEYQADVIRLEQPVPVSLQGKFTTASTEAFGTGWWQINDRPVWWASPGRATAAVELAESDAVVLGVRLPNGIIWAREVRALKGGTHPKLPATAPE